MTFTLIDLILLLLIFGFVIYGFFMGLIEAIGSILGLIAGVYLAGKFSVDFSEVIKPLAFGSDTAADIISFILIFTLASRLIGLIFYILGKAFHLFSFIPFLKSINKIGGALLGLVEGTLAVGLVVSFVSQFTLTEWLSRYIATSKIALLLIKISSVFLPFIPEVYEQIKNLL